MVQIVKNSSVQEATEGKGKRTKQESEGVKKWGAKVMDAGYSMIPSVIFQFQGELKLSSTDLNILLQLADHWWTAKKLPFPSKKLLADRMKVHPTTIRRRIAKLEERGLIERQKHFIDRNQTSNRYSLKGLVEAIHPLAIRALKVRQEKKKTKIQKGGE